MPYGQSPWIDAGNSAQEVGSSLTRIAMARQIGQQRAQQFAQQIALRAQQEAINQQRANSQGDVDVARVGNLNSTTDLNYQKFGHNDQMDTLARAIGQNIYNQKLPGGVSQALSPQPAQMTMPQGGDFSSIQMQLPTQGGPTVQAGQQVNQADLIRNVMQLIAMHNPNELGTMMMGKDIPRGAVNVNEITGEQTQGMPPAMPAQNASMKDPVSGLTPYQVQQLILAKARLKDEEDSRKITDTMRENSPDYKMAIADRSESGDEASADASSNGSKQLDADTARQFLQRAGGDKDKARQMAKDAGYSF